MAYYQRMGDVPPKRHTQHRDAEGNLYYEELMGEEGFNSDSSLLYHRFVPSAIVESRVWDIGDYETVPNHPLLPRHLLLHDLFVQSRAEDGTPTLQTGVDVVTGRRLVLGNGDVRLLYVVADTPSPYYRSAIGDECVYLERGGARVETAFGAVEVGQGDYLIIPRATTHRWIPLVEGDEGFTEPLRAYVIEASSHIGPPSRYLSKFGQLLEHSPFCERDLRLPVGPLLAEDLGADPTEHTEVYIKHRGGGEHSSGGMVGTIYTYPFHPFDVVGWDGCLYPYVFNLADYEPITGRVHQPPPVHQVWEGHNFVVCNFVPRKVDYHPLSIPVPYYHSNVDSDEIMFYVDGDYEARKGSGIAKGSISVHPGGHAHGPQPGATEKSIGVEYFDETAVMVDTFRPLELGEAGRAVDDGAYAQSWNKGLREGGRPQHDAPGEDEVFSTT